MKKSGFLIFTSVPLLFLLIYYKVFFADYAYLDEAHQLWHNQDGTNFSMFLIQGRWLTGKLIDELFGSIRHIAELKMLRLISLAGWTATTLTWLWLARTWLRRSGINNHILYLSIVFIITSPAVAITIGWASCVEIFLATLFGLLSGSMLYRSLSATGAVLPLKKPALIVTVVFGLCSLFLYQNAFGMFLIPFLLELFNGNTANPLCPGTPDQQGSERRRRLITAVCIYLFIYLLYFILFRYQLLSAGIGRSDRAGISTDLSGKFSFFFSGPLPKAFAINFLYHTRTLFPQILAPLVIVAFLASVFIRWKFRGIKNNLLLIVCVIALLALIYLPSLAVTENFSSYRTMLPFSLAIFLLLMIQLFHFIKTKKYQDWMMAGISLLLIALGIYNFQVQFTRPLEREYQSLRSYLNRNYSPSITSIYFVRPRNRIFQERYGIYSVKDEFGNPSTEREWVPDPITRQIITEITGNRDTASRISIIQFADEKSFTSSGLKLNNKVLLVDMNQLILDSGEPGTPTK
ncbi:MAG: glucosyltransferase domain-containing protein [Chitinophagaceae bacterium]